MKLPRVGSAVILTTLSTPVFLVVVGHRTDHIDGGDYFLGKENDEEELYYIIPGLDEYTVLDIKTYYSKFK